MIGAVQTIFIYYIDKLTNIISIKKLNEEQFFILK